MYSLYQDFAWQGEWNRHKIKAIATPTPYYVWKENREQPLPNNPTVLQCDWALGTLPQYRLYELGKKNVPQLVSYHSRKAL